MTHGVDGEVGRVRVAQRADLCRRDVVGRFNQACCERRRGGVAAGAVAGRRMIGILSCRGPIHHCYAEPTHARLMAARALTRDAGVVHRRAGKGFECGLRVAALTGLGNGDVICWRLFRHNVRERQSGTMARRAATGNARVIHGVNGVVARARMAQRASLSCWDVVRWHGDCE